MPALLEVTNIALPEGVTHIATDFQLSDDLRFNNITAESIKNEKFLTHILFPNTLDLSKTYYARARLLLSTGYTIWSSIDVFLVDDVIDIDRVDNLPANISIPLITTTSDKNNHKPTLFSIIASEYSVDGNAPLDSTTYIIEDIDNKVVWSSVEDKINLTHINITPDIITLKDRCLYIIKVQYTSKSNDKSQIASKIIYVNNNDRGKILIDDLTAVDHAVVNNFTLYNILNLVTTDVTIEKLVNKENVVVYTATVTADPHTVTIPADTLEPATNYIITVEPAIDTGTIGKRYMLLRTV